MTLIYDGSFMVAWEGTLGTLKREERLCRRIMAGELSYDFIVEIAESTLPFRNIANLLENLISYQEWTSKNLNLKAICLKIIKACEMEQQPGKLPMTGGNLGAEDVDFAGNEVKRYPHTYDAILYPHMVRTYESLDTPEARAAWKRRTESDGSVGIMKRRVALAEKPRAQSSNIQKFERWGEVS